MIAGREVYPKTFEEISVVKRRRDARGADAGRRSLIAGREAHPKAFEEISVVKRRRDAREAEGGALLRRYTD